MSFARTEDGLWHVQIGVHARVPIVTAILACGRAMPVTCESTRIPDGEPCCDCVPKLPTPRRVRAALFYTDRYDRPTLRVEVRSEDTVDGRSGFLYAVGLDSMMEVTAALSGCMEGDFPGLVRLCAARERCAACDETCDYAWSDGRGCEHCVQPEPEDDVSIYRLILRDEEKRRAL